MTRRITALTKEGIRGLQSGRYTNAILSFRHAIQCLKEKGMPVQHKNVIQVDDDEVDSCGPALEHVRLCFSETNVSWERSPHNVFEIYDSAFMFPCDPDAPAATYELSIVLCYNLALAHHLAGLCGVEHSSQHLQEALHYYKLSLTVFRSRSSFYFDDWYALVLGILTNIGFICFHFWQLDEVRTCIEHIDKLLSSPAVLGLSDKDWEFFFSTLTHSKDFHAAVAPAA
eukprot:scaffold38210_cov191-Amphora_coffeaeformis.AAC.4